MCHVTYAKLPTYRATCTYECECAMSHMKESWCMWDVDTLDVNVTCRVWLSHTHSYVTRLSHTRHVNVTCRVWLSRVTYEWVMPHMNESCHIWMSHVTYERVVVHIGCWHAWCLCECVMSHVWLSHVKHVGVTCHIWMSHVTFHYECGTLHMNESCHTWMSHVTYEWVMSRMKESSCI